jgi:hypothetical protein
MLDARLNVDPLLLSEDNESSSHVPFNAARPKIMLQKEIWR